MTEEINTIIKNALENKGQSMRWLASQIGRSYPNLLNTLSGKAGMNLDTFLKIARVLDIKIVLSDDSVSFAELQSELNRTREDNENLRTLTQFLKKENEELKAKLGE